MEIKIRKNTAKWLDWNQYINWCSHYTGKLVEFSVNEPDKPSYLQNHYYYDVGPIVYRVDAVIEPK
jgi:hypothetical protein